VKTDLKASAIIECPWEIAISEIRLCLILLSYISVLTGFYAIKKSNRKYAELSFLSGIAFAVLLVKHTSLTIYSSFQATLITYPLKPPRSTTTTSVTSKRSSQLTRR
jgi:hypothetical protein